MNGFVKVERSDMSRDEKKKRGLKEGGMLNGNRGGKGKGVVELKVPKGVVRWSRVVEETRISDRALVLGAIGGTCLALLVGFGGWLYTR